MTLYEELVDHLVVKSGLDRQLIYSQTILTGSCSGELPGSTGARLRPSFSSVSGRTGTGRKKR